MRARLIGASPTTGEALGPHEVPASTGPQARPSAVLLLAVWLAMITWLGELAVLAGQKFVGHKLRVLHPEAMLLGPVAYLALFAACGLVLALAHRRWPRVLSLRAAILPLVALAFAGLLLIYVEQLGDISAGLLALGLGVESSRHIVRHAPGFFRVVRRTLAPAVLLVATLSLGTKGLEALREHWTLSRLPAARDGAPNVLLIILDTVRAMSMSAYGFEQPTTPQLERFASRGVRFEHAISTSSWTLPSHASMFTGLYPFELGSEINTPLEPTFPTLAEVMRANGYATAGFVANLYYTSAELDLDRGFAHYEDYPLSLGQLVISFSPGRAVANNERLRRLIDYHQIPNRKSAERINGDFLRWISRNRERPFFAFLNYFDAHEPYVPPEPFRSRFERPGPRPVYWYEANRVEPFHVHGRVSGHIPAQTGAYEGALAYLDHQLGRLFGELERRGVLENTVVIVTSDHGEEIGEHGGMGHMDYLYRTVLWVPLLVVFPGRVPEGVRVPNSVTLRDLPATILDLAGVRSDSLSLPGRSLASYWRGTQSAGALGPALLLSEISASSPMRSLFVDGYHYIRHVSREGERDELYRVHDDPLERRNLAGSPGGEEVLSVLRPLLARPMAVEDDATYHAPRGGGKALRQDER